MEFTWLYCSGVHEKHTGKGGEKCSKKLLRYSSDFFGTIELKCLRCGQINTLDIREKNDGAK